MGGTLLAIYPSLARCSRQGNSKRLRRRRVQFLSASSCTGMDIPPRSSGQDLFFLLVFGMLCINVLVRRPWTEAEKLSYPIIQLPLQMTDGRSSLLSNRMMWIGFGLGAGLDILNGLHFLYPIIPGLGGRLYDLRPFFTNKPWNAIGWTPVAVFSLCGWGLDS